MPPKRKTTARSKASKRPKTSSPSVNTAAAAVSRDGSEHVGSEKGNDSDVIDVDAGNNKSGDDLGSEDELGNFPCLWVFNG